jgi:hypothetical protein
MDNRKRPDRRHRWLSRLEDAVWWVTIVAALGIGVWLSILALSDAASPANYAATPLRLNDAIAIGKPPRIESVRTLYQGGPTPLRAN